MDYTAMVVDDSGLMRSIIRRALLSLGVRADSIVEATDGEQALALLRRSPFHLVLTDLHMPIKGGLELAQTMLKDPALINIPIVVISSEPSECVFESLRCSGVKACLAKPFEVNEFRAAVLPYLEMSDDIDSSPQTNRVARCDGVRGSQHNPAVDQALPSIIADVPSLLRESLVTAMQAEGWDVPCPIDSGMLDQAPQDIVATSVSFNGSASGAVEIVAGRELGQYVAARLLRLEAVGSTTIEEGLDAIKELTNMTCGVLLRVFQGCPEGVPSMGIPRVLDDAGARWSTALRDPRSVFLQAGDHRFAVRLLAAA